MGWFNHTRRFNSIAALILGAAMLTACGGPEPTAPAGLPAATATALGTATSGGAPTAAPTAVAPRPTPSPAQDPAGAAASTAARPTPGDTQQAPAAPVPQLQILPFIQGLDMYAGPVDIPVDLHIPRLQVSAPVLGVGITKKGVMDVPSPPRGDPVWSKVFWYRGSGVPGAPGTATIAGHYTDIVGKPAVFTKLGELRPGDEVQVRDAATGAVLSFQVVETSVYPVDHLNDPAVLARIYGPGPVSGRGALPSPDGRSFLTLITCAGEFVNGQFQERLVVYAERR